jgi:hypothetical protein
VAMPLRHDFRISLLCTRRSDEVSCPRMRLPSFATPC